MDRATGNRIWQQAVSFAARQHEGQRLMDGVTPYFAHPVRVALTVRHVFGESDEVALAIALLHDPFEVTTTIYDKLLNAFGKPIADAVAALVTDARVPVDEREPEHDRQLSAASWQARMVKLADVYDNFCDARDEKERAKIARKARRAIQWAGDAPELQKAVAIVRKLIGG